MSKKPLLLLHGALGSVDQFAEIQNLLSTDFDLLTLNFSGHGGNPIDQDFTINLFVKDILNFLEEKQMDAIDVFGYSMGGYVALKLASENPGLLNKIMTLGTKFNWTKESADKEVKMLNPDVIEEKFPKFANSLKKIHHPEDWKKAMHSTASMMLNLGNGAALKKDDFEKIKNQILICIGSEGNMVSREESQTIVNHLQNGQLKIIEGFKHPIESVDKKKLSDLMIEYF